MKVLFKALAQTAEIRTATYQGTDHVVVPVVALVGDAVIDAVGSTGPELVPSDLLEVAPGGWDGRPILPDHPNSGLDSANSPETLDRLCFGQMFNTRFENGRLLTEAWINPSRAEEVGPEAVSVVERARNKEPIEVSVGARVLVMPRAGISPSGQKYQGVWAGLVPDHLAMLPEGRIGACSNAMGCGAPRAASRPPYLRFLQGDTSGAASESIRRALYDALAVDPYFEYLHDIWPDTSTAVYCAYDPSSAKTRYYQRTYKVESTDPITQVSLNDDREEVVMKTSFEPAPAGYTSNRAACGGNTSCSCQHQGDRMDRVQFIAALIAASAFAEKHRPFLESLSDEELQRLTPLTEDEDDDPPVQQSADPSADPQPTPATPATQAADPPPAPVAQPIAASASTPPPLTEEQFLQLAPPHVRAAFDRMRAEEEANRDSLVRSLTAVQSEFTEEQLRQKSTDELARLHNLVAYRPDYSGARAAADAGPTSYPQFFSDQEIRVARKRSTVVATN